MKIALWGAYFTGFYSDDLLYYALAGELESMGHEVYPVAHNEFRKDTDFCIIGGGTILGDGLSVFKPPCPFAVLGAGYRLPSPQLEKLKNATHIKVRGYCSLIMLQQHGIEAEVCGDPIILLKTPPTTHNYELGLIHRDVDVISNWLDSFEPSIKMGISSDKEGIMYDPNYSLGILQKISECRTIVSGRLHPFITSIMMGIPAMTAEFEFNKVKDVISGLGICVNDSVLGITTTPRFPTQEELNHASIILELKRERLREHIKEILCQR